MAYTSQQLAALREAMASGVLRVRGPDGQETLFRSLGEMKAQEAAMAAELEPTAARIKRTILSFYRE
jgi:hypothetical protein